jgi:predicted AlkP superfamily phosphohydrolase/phosphomutase
MGKKVFVLGLDGATLTLLDRKALPHIKRLIDKGVSGELLSRPAVTPIAWTSMVTGVNPGKHGIFGFRKGDRLINSQNKKAKELWDYAKSIVINVPMTYPARPIDGVMITGMMTPTIDSAGAVFPESERAYLKKVDYVIEPEIKLSEIKKSLEIRTKIAHYYAQNYNWQLFFHVFREFDVLQHFFWGQDLRYYRIVDTLLGELQEKFPDSFFMIVSDHGFTHVDKTFNLERWLKKNFGEKAWAGGWGAVYIKTKNQKLKTKNELIKRLEKIKYQGGAVLDVYGREEVYWGPYVEEGPDVIVSPKREHGFTFGTSDSEIFDRSSKKNGCHLENAVFILAGSDIPKKKIQGKIYDVFPTIFKILDIKIPEGIDGRSLL